MTHPLDKARQAAKVVFGFWSLVVVLTLATCTLTGCAGVPPGVEPEGWRCDPSGACWPEGFTVKVPIRELTYPAPMVDRICREGATRHDVDLAANPQWKVFACTIAPDGPRPIVILPDVPPPCWTTEDLRQHERGHVAGVTQHNMIERNTICRTSV